MDNTGFFETPTEQSTIKQMIVSKYFGTWVNVIKNSWASDNPIAYVDLFSGPGVYEDGTESVPLRVVRTVLDDRALVKRIRLFFNDQNENYIEALKDNIRRVDSQDVLRNNIKYSKYSVGSEFYQRLNFPSNVPVFSYVDPFGYKGITRELIGKLIQNNGSDCIFFFNYSRLNMAFSTNPRFDTYLSNIFGAERMIKLNDILQDLPPSQRESIVLNALSDSLCEIGAINPLAFKFYSQEKQRTSHFIVFVSKHPLATRIMKQTMYSVSAKDADGVALFEYHDQKNFGIEYPQKSLFDSPFQGLITELKRKNSGQKIVVEQLCAFYECNYKSPFVKQNVKAALLQLEEDGLLTVEGRKKQTSKGKKTLPDAAIVVFK